MNRKTTSLRLALILGASVLFNHLSVHAGPGTAAIKQKIADGNPGGLPMNTLANGDAFGRSAATLGDLDGDGVSDLAVGVFADDTGGDLRGAVHILFLHADGTVKATTKIADGNPGGLPMNTLTDEDFFGGSIAAPGDLDGDGVPDLAVGVVGDDTGGERRGAIYILFLNADGTVKANTKIADNTGGLPMNTLMDGDNLGISVAALGDLDGDGVPDLAVGANADDTGGNSRGAVYIFFLNADGTVKGNTKIADGNAGGLPMGTLADVDFFGFSVTSLGDLDGDGVPDLAVGARMDDTGGIFRGAVHILFLHADGTVKANTKIADNTGGLPMDTLADRDFFGASVAALGDLDGNGLPDLAVGTSGDNTGGIRRGAVHILFLHADGTVKANTKIADGNADGLPTDTLANSDNFGGSVAALGDPDGDGVPDLAVGTSGDNTGGSGRGAVYLLNLGDLPFTVTTGDDEFDTPSLSGSGLLSLREALRDADAANGGEFRTINFAPGLAGETITLTMGELGITDQGVKITAAGLAGGVTISGDNNDRVLNIDAASEVVLECLTLRDGRRRPGSSQAGGAILNLGNLTLRDVTISDNTAHGNGGGIHNRGTLTVSGSTFSGNTTNFVGGGINSTNGGNLTVVNSTFTGNTANGVGGGGIHVFTGTALFRHLTVTNNLAPNGPGGGILNSFGAVTVSNSIVSGNSALTDFDLSGPITLTGANLIGGTPDLAPLGDYGGKTPTMPPRPGSGAVDMAVFTPLPATDQRGDGFSRFRGAGPDVGAAEGIETGDFQPDNRIGRKRNPATHKRDNLYNTNGAGQKLTVKLRGSRSQKTWLSVQNDARFIDDLTLRATRPNRTVKMTSFKMSGGRQNVTAALKGAGFRMPGVAPGEIVLFQSRIRAKSRRQKAKQTVKCTTTSGFLPSQSDVNLVKVK